MAPTLRSKALAVPNDASAHTAKVDSNDTSSDSDSDYFIQKPAYTNKKPAYTHPNMSSNIAAVEHLTSKHCPVLTAGDISPKVLVDLTDAHNEYFLAKEIADADKVKKILGGFRCVHIRDWISCERERLVNLSYAEFMSELRENYLPPDWEDSVRAQILAMQMRRNVKFWDWCQEMRALNIVLRGTASHLDDTALRNQLEASLEPGLRTYCSHKKLNKVTDLKKWVQAVKEADEMLRDDRKRSRDIFAEEAALRAQKRPALASHSRFANVGTNSAPNAPSSSNNTQVRKCPKLEPEERKLLAEHNGCFKCRRFNQSHGAHSCPNDFPDGSKYQKITPYRDAAGNAPKSYRDVAKGTAGSKGKAVTDAAADESNVSEEDDFVTAVMPSAVLGNGSFSEDDVSPPLRSKHFVAKLNIAATHLDFPLTFSTLIDNGAHLVLIRPEVVEALKLERHLLKVPETVSVAISENNKKKVKMTLHHYVKFEVTSLDNAWTSKTVHAIIAPGLCMPVILGLPFLVHNDIVTDHKARSCIDKKCGYNLMNPAPIAPPRPPRRRAKDQIKFTKAAKKATLAELTAVCQKRINDKKLVFEVVKDVDVVAAIKDAIGNIALKERLKKVEKNIRTEFQQVFEEIPHVKDLPIDYMARIKLKDAERTIANRTYACPRKYRDAFKTLIDQHLQAGRIRPSSSAYASPCFLIPKPDPTVLPRWVNDYRQLNDITVPDNHPLPRTDDILNDCARGKIWSTIDMTNSFFQTLMHPDDVHLTAVNTPFGLYEWLVMPMGLRNSPAIHQRRVTAALREHIGKICHIYLDDIVIWSDSVEDHIRDVRKIFSALRAARLYINEKKTNLFQTEIKFLGHKISARGIEADSKKVEAILAWPRPRTATLTRSFIGLVRYIAAFLPGLAEHTAALGDLITKDADRHFPKWTEGHQHAFDSIKKLVVGRDCLTTIDFSLMPDHKIYVTTDASDLGSGAVLSFGRTWETARPVAFESMTFKGAQLNYPVHEKEMLAIIRALTKWRVDLLGVPFLIYTDHKTLENFHTQRDLSRRQARWMEFMSQYDAKIVYVKGEENTVADALSRLPTTTQEELERTARYAYPYCPDGMEEDIVASVMVGCEEPAIAVARALATRGKGTALMKEVCATFAITADKTLLDQIRAGYAVDSWIANQLMKAEQGMPGIQKRNGLWYVGNRLIIPRVGELRETLFRLAHDVLGHFGFDKTYASLRDSYFWPNMRRDLENAYVPGCIECQRNKSATSKPTGPLHPLPVPDERGDSVAIDFVGPLPEDEGQNMIVTFTDRLGADVRILPCRTSLTADELAVIFFNQWYCENGLPLEIISDRDKLFVSRFWKSLHKLTGTKIKMSTAYHPQTDGASERTNKTVNQLLRYHVERNQSGWVKALPLVRFNIMNTVNMSTGFSPFQLRMGRSARVVPPLVLPDVVNTSEEDERAQHVIKFIENIRMEAQDNLLRAKISQAAQANKSRSLTFPFVIGGRVRLSTLNRRHEYKASGEKRVAKFMPRFDGPYTIIDIDEEHSTVTLDLPNSPNAVPTFHTSEVVPYKENDAELFPNREFSRPPPITTEDGNEEYFIRDIIDERRRGRGTRYLVRWIGYGPEENRWISGSELKDTEALDVWLAKTRMEKGFQ